MGATVSRASEYSAETSIDAVPAALPSHGEPSTRRRPGTHQEPSWIAETFVDVSSAEMDLCADRSEFIRRREIMDHIPSHIKKRIMNPSSESQIRGFEDLFLYLDSLGADVLRQLVVSYFNDTVPLRGHLSQSLARRLVTIPESISLSRTSEYNPAQVR